MNFTIIKRYFLLLGISICFSPLARSLPNPASVNCAERGGKVIMDKRGDGGIFGICEFKEGRKCEEWALFRGDCPKGGVDVSTYITREATYCALKGGKVLDKETRCQLPSGNICGSIDLFKGRCKERN